MESACSEGVSIDVVMASAVIGNRSWWRVCDGLPVPPDNEAPDTDGDNEYERLSYDRGGMLIDVDSNPWEDEDVEP